MKSKLVTLIVVALVATTQLSKAQDIVKINLSSLAFTNISLQGEHILNDNSSISLGLSYLPSASLPSAITDKDSAGNLSSMNFSGWAITPEYRYYLSGNAPKGFYLAGYFRYSSYTFDNFTYTYTSLGSDKHLAASGDWTVTG